ncbi:two-component system response regulator OmpR [Ampullimonas aquatilis]|uniref:osmolarity response regulator transcription factor OmpR n=1 Tax=Ampullimonas aquatilis TaxID=1341549 RepID=UPI003C781CEC
MNTTDKPIAVLVLDDEADLRTLLQRYLTEQGMQVRTIADAPQLDRLLTREHFDVLILDLMMPGEDGLSICRRLRAAGETIPIIMLTAKGDPVERIIGLEMGADDYLAKPFTPRELVARIQALLRRQNITLHGGSKTREEWIHFGAFKLNLTLRTLDKAGQNVPLSSGEFNLLKAMVCNAGRPLGRERLIELAHGRDHDALDRSIDVQVMRLRKLIEDHPAEPKHIKTVWGVGYVFVMDGHNPVEQSD